MTSPAHMPRTSPEHLIWRLESKSEDALEGWFLFSGAQVQALVLALKHTRSCPQAWSGGAEQRECETNYKP